MPRSGPGLPVQVVVPSASRSSNSDSGVIALPGHTADWGGNNSLTVKLVITAITGSIVVAVEHSDTGTSGWTALDTFPSQVGTGTVIRTVPSAGKIYMRVAWTIVTGPVTFSVTFAANPAQMN